MPTPLLKSLADRAGVPVAKAEEYWDWAKGQAEKKFGKPGPRYWAYVNALTRRRLQLEEVNLKFSTFLTLLHDKYQQPPEQGSSDA